MVDIETDDDGVNATAEIVLEDFEVFDIRDVMNVVAYSAMSSGGRTAKTFCREHPSFSPTHGLHFLLLKSFLLRPPTFFLNLIFCKLKLKIDPINL